MGCDSAMRKCIVLSCPHFGVTQANSSDLLLALSVNFCALRNEIAENNSLPVEKDFQNNILFRIILPEFRGSW
jgi:hypothetical protein